MQPVLNSSSTFRCTFSLKMFLLSTSRCTFSLMMSLLFVVFNLLLGGMLLTPYKGKVWLWRWPFSGSVWPKAWIPFCSKPPAAMLGVFRQQLLSTKYCFISEWLVGALVWTACNDVVPQVCNVIYDKILGFCSCLFKYSWMCVALWDCFVFLPLFSTDFFQELCGAVAVSPNSDVFLLACFIVRLLHFCIYLWKISASVIFSLLCRSPLCNCQLWPHPD